MTERMKNNLEELERTIKLLEMQLARIRIMFTSGGLTEQQYLEENETLERGLETLKKESEKAKSIIDRYIRLRNSLSRIRAMTILARLSADKAFYFYVAYGQSTGVRAESLEEFVQITGTIDIRSIKFHLERGDFQSWMKSIGDLEMASRLDEMKNQNLKDETLRKELTEILKTRIELLKSRLEN